ncbi:hypothetical protein SCALM49S_04139 [Streptomyces californicus]
MGAAGRSGGNAEGGDEGGGEGAPRPAIRTGTWARQAAEAGAGSGTSRARSAPYTPNIAVRCQRKAVIATPLAATTVRQTRGRSSRRAAGARSSSTAPTSQRPWASRARVGGAMLLTFSPGIPDHGQRIRSERDQRAGGGQARPGQERGAADAAVGAEEAELVDGQPDEGEVEELDVRDAGREPQDVHRGRRAGQGGDGAPARCRLRAASAAAG